MIPLKAEIYDVNSQKSSGRGSRPEAVNTRLLCVHMPCPRGFVDLSVIQVDMKDKHVTSSVLGKLV